MYVPAHFKAEDPAFLRRIMAERSFALLITADAAGVPFATHLPFMFDPGRGAQGTLLAHMARANPQWQHFKDGAEALVVFAGPHAYVSPSWYEAHPSVPTWNYAAVHVYGRPRILEEAADKRAMLRRLVETNEAGYEKPWRMELPEAYEAGMLRGIVAFEIAVTRIEGKAKLSQNRNAADHARVIAALEAEAHPESRAVAALMRELAPRPKA